MRSGREKASGCTRRSDLDLKTLKRPFVGLLIGLSGGSFGGLVGVGGGIVMIPLMTWLAKLTQHQAHGTSLVAIVFVSIVGAGTYFIHGSTDWKAAGLLAISSIMTARFGALFAHSLPERKLKKIFGGFVICMSVLLLSKGLILETGFGLSPWIKVVTLLAAGAFTGFVVGMMGVGGGAIMVPVLVTLAGMPQHLAQGTSLLAMAPTSISGAFAHYRLGNVVTDIVLCLAVGSLVGGYLGGTIAHLLPEMLLRVLFAVMLIWIGVRYLRA